jgi:hypothetical protein
MECTRHHPEQSAPLMSEMERTQFVMPLKKQPSGERRARVRYFRRSATTEPGNERGTVGACWAQVHDLSLDGISLGLSWRVPPRTLLAIDRLGELTRPLRVRVIHTTRDVAGGWLAGCKFLQPLSNEDLHSLQQPTPQDVRHQ